VQELGFVLSVAISYLRALEGCRIGLDDARRGIVHVIGPEQGLTLPGITIVCGDSHTSTHGAFGALAFGIGTSEVEHVLATQTVIQRPAKNMRVLVEGSLPLGVSAKDVILAIIGKLGTAGGTGYVIEYAGRAIREMTMEGRMTVCNMSIEAGARAGLIAPDETTFQYLEGRPYAPHGGAWDLALGQWRRLPSDKGANFDSQLDLLASDIPPMVTWGTSPQDALPITDVVPDPANAPDENRREANEVDCQKHGEAESAVDLVRPLHVQERVVQPAFFGRPRGPRADTSRLQPLVTDRARSRQVLLHQLPVSHGVTELLVYPCDPARESEEMMLVGSSAELLAALLENVTRRLPVALGGGDALADFLHQSIGGGIFADGHLLFQLVEAGQAKLHLLASRDEIQFFATGHRLSFASA